MKKPSRNYRKLSALRRKAGYVMGASLLAAGMSARAADKVTPEQLYEGGTNTYSNWIELGGGGFFTGGNKAQAQQLLGLPGGAFGGIEDAHYQQVVATNTIASLDGHYLPENHDYLLKVGVAKDNLGYFRISYDNFRT